MKSFKEFRMPPITMARDNAVVGVRDTDIEEAPLKIPKHKGVEVLGNDIVKLMQKDDTIILAVAKLLKKKVDLVGPNKMVYNK